MSYLGYEVKSANVFFNAIAAYEFQPNLVMQINMPVLTVQLIRISRLV
jgi:hypothetical protein